MMNHTIPSVRKLIGILMRRKSNPTVAFTKLSTTATTIAVHKLSTITQGTTYDAIAIAIPQTKMFNRNFMCYIKNK